MQDTWHTFPAQMGDHRAFISFNAGYAEGAENDGRDFLLKIRVEIKNPTPGGMPTSEEFRALSALGELLDDALTGKGAVYAGRITVDGHRYFHYYVGFPEQVASEIIDRASAQTSYELRYIYRNDAEKEGYWKDLYPTGDDWQVIRDMEVLEALRNDGDIAERPREVSHWAYFADMNCARAFADWAESRLYNVMSIEPTEDEGRIEINFSHKGTMVLEDITRHTISINNKAEELNGDYDGWETSVEK